MLETSPQLLKDELAALVKAPLAGPDVPAGVRRADAVRQVRSMLAVALVMGV